MGCSPLWVVETPQPFENFDFLGPLAKVGRGAPDVLLVLLLSPPASFQSQSHLLFDNSAPRHQLAVLKQWPCRPWLDDCFGLCARMLFG